jgi:general secretion pathway protein G
MKRSANGGFTLVEILIVVIILGILAAIVIPQFTQASTQAREANLKTNLQTVRSQLLLYKVQHLESYPGALFTTQMTQYTDISGGVATSRDATHTFGPYIQSIPVNPISNVNTLRIVTGATTVFAAPTTDGGWWFNSTTGGFQADLKASWTAADGSLYNTF